VTRGVGTSRRHVPEPGITPTVLAMTMPLPRPEPAVLEAGIAAITTPDLRWARCDIKATTLLANILAQREAAAADAREAILVRHGEALEGSASNIFLVQNGCLITPPKGPQLLPGITRDLVLELAATAGIPSSERPIPVAELVGADELWITSSTREIMPVTRLDGHPIGTGRAGPMWRQLLALFHGYKEAFVRGEHDDD
jgi:D-alanine transaminase